MVERKVAMVVHPPQLGRDFYPQGQRQRPEVVSSLNKESIYQIVDKIKNEYF